MSTPDGVRVDGPRSNQDDRYDEVLTDEALDFLAGLHRAFDARRRELVAARAARYEEIARGGSLDFLTETKDVREDDTWRVAPHSPGLVDRRAEITGPTDRKMTINALNSGAKVWLADLEDANTPLWENVIEGQLNLRDAIERRIDFTSPEGKTYALDDSTATIVVRPRGWHLPEKHLRVDGEPGSGSLVDFGLHAFHSAPRLHRRGRGIFFYLPKMEHHLEARLWNDVFAWAEDALDLPQGAMRATVLIETLPAAFQMEEILYELRDHSIGLNAGRWDYIFSMIKVFRDRPEFVLPDRNDVKMTVPFMRSYTELLVKTCHARGTFAMGGMAALIPSRKDPEANQRAIEAVREDKAREAKAGFDGTWVAHPDVVSTAMAAFDEVLGDKPNQIDKQRPDVNVTPEQLLDAASTPGEITEEGLRNDVSVGFQYISFWLGGRGAAGINNLMEDAATAEISRSQVWQWLHNSVRLPDGQVVTADLVDRMIDEELAAIRRARGDEAFVEGGWDEARSLFTETAISDEYVDFLTLPAYERMP